MPVNADSRRRTDKPHKGISRQLRRPLRARMSGNASPIQFARGNARDTNARPFPAPDRPVAVPHGDRGTSECCAGRDDRGAKSEK